MPNRTAFQAVPSRGTFEREFPFHSAVRPHSPKAMHQTGNTFYVSYQAFWERLYEAEEIFPLILNLVCERLTGQCSQLKILHDESWEKMDNSKK